MYCSAISAINKDKVIRSRNSICVIHLVVLIGMKGGEIQRKDWKMEPKKGLRKTERKQIRDINVKNTSKYFEHKPFKRLLKNTK